MIDDWVVVTGVSRPVEDRETFHRLDDRRRVARAVAWLLYMPTRWVRELLMWAALLPAAAPEYVASGWVVAPESARDAGIARVRTRVLCVPPNGPGVVGLGTRRTGAMT